MPCRSSAPDPASYVPASPAAAATATTDLPSFAAPTAHDGAAKKGKGVTVAIVDAFNDPKLAADLGHYRSHFHSGACTTKSGCLKIVNQSGNTSPLPKPGQGLGHRRIARRGHGLGDLPELPHPASRGNSGAFTNRTWAPPRRPPSPRARGSCPTAGLAPSSSGTTVANPDFNHPGDVIAFAAGDFGTGPAYPTDLQYVTAVGGTSLKHARASAAGPKRVGRQHRLRRGHGQRLLGAGAQAVLAASRRERVHRLRRTGPRTTCPPSPTRTPACSSYDSYKSQPSGLSEIGGTSAATPIMTAIYALAGSRP